MFLATWCLLLCISCEKDETSVVQKDGVQVGKDAAKAKVEASKHGVNAGGDDGLKVHVVDKGSQTVYRNQIKFHCIKGACVQTCKEGKDCDATCDGGECKQTCAKEATCEFNCSGGDCVQACPAGSKACNLTCSGGGCEQTCEAEDCDKSCSGHDCT